MPIPLGILAVAGAGAGAAGSFDLLETTLISSNTASVTFSNLNTYTDYKHLVIRWVARSDRANSIDGLRIQFNGDNSSGTYVEHRLEGNGSTVVSASATAAASITLGFFPAASASSDIFGSGVTEILDFSSSSKNTVTRTLVGHYIGTSTNQRLIALRSGLWPNTAALTSFTLTCISQFIAGSRFSLYGIKG